MPARQSYKQGTPNWTDLATSDVEAAKSFYGDLMGWTFEPSSTQQGGEYLGACLDGKSCAGIMQHPQPGAPAAWNTYIAVDDVSKTCETVEASGGTVFMSPTPVGDSGQMALATDPSGAMFGLWQAGDSIGCEVVNEDGALIWNELITDDIDKAAPFYAEAFGHEITTQDMGSPDLYHLFNIDGEAVGGGMKKPAEAEGMPNHWVSYFCVADIDACVAKATELGGSIVAPPFDAPSVGRMAGIADPQGAFFMLMKPEQPSS